MLKMAVQRCPAGCNALMSRSHVVPSSDPPWTGPWRHVQRNERRLDSILKAQPISTDSTILRCNTVIHLKTSQYILLVSSCIILYSLLSITQPWHKTAQTMPQQRWISDILGFEPRVPGLIRSDSNTATTALGRPQRTLQLELHEFNNTRDTSMNNKMG